MQAIWFKPIRQSAAFALLVETYKGSRPAPRLLQCWAHGYTSQSVCRNKRIWLGGVSVEAN